MIDQSILDEYAQALKDNYGDTTNRTNPNVKAYDISFEPGSKYMRVVMHHFGQRSSHSFIVVNENNPKNYPVGTILKSATWKAPTLNFPRGNVLKKDWKNVRWTGC